MKNDDRIADIGCGEGRHTIGFAADEKISKPADVAIVGIDISHADLTTAKNRLRGTENLLEKKLDSVSFIQADIFDLPFPKNSFQHIIFSEVLEHLPNYSQALDKIIDLLSPGGTLALSVPRAWCEKICWKLSSEYHNTPGGHVHIFAQDQLKTEIEAHGLVLVEKYGKHALHTPYWWLRCLFWNKGEDFFLIKSYHKILVWDLMKRPWITRIFDQLCNPWLGKSIALIFKKL